MIGLMATTFQPAPPTTEPLPDNGHRPPPAPAPGDPSARRDTGVLFAVAFSLMALIAGVFGVGLGFRAVDESGDGTALTGPRDHAA